MVKDKIPPPPRPAWYPTLNDPVNRPRHYTFSVIEPIDAIEAWGLGFHTGNATKYIARHRHKGRALEDLKKARWYLDREIQRLEQLERNGDEHDQQ